MLTRQARPADWPRIVEFHRKQNLRDGTSYPLTPLFSPDGSLAPNVFLALVTEREGEGVVGCVYFEMTAEMLFACLDPEATRELASHIDEAAYILRQRGCESLHCLVPKSLVPEGKRPGPIARLLKGAGFLRDDHWLGHFFKNLR